MKRVVHLVNQDAFCGYGEYGRELDVELNKEFSASVVPPGGDVGDADVIIASYGSPATSVLTPQQTDAWRAEGRKVVLLFRESEGDLVEHCAVPVKPFLGHVDAIVTHEPTSYSTDFIPISFPVVTDLPPASAGLVLGSAGFYDPMKHFETVIDVARDTGAVLNLPIAQYSGSDLGFVTNRFAQLKAARESSAQDEDFLELVAWPVDAVVRQLARSTVNMFWHHPRVSCSQSTSVGMAIAAKRPILISENRRFLVLHTQYADEVYIGKSAADCVRIVTEIDEALQCGETVRTPKRLYDAYSWDTCGAQYRALVRRLVGQA